MSITGIEHVQLTMPRGREANARAFYGNLLGMTEVEKPATLSGEGCWFEAGEARVHLGVDTAFRAATKAHPGLIAVGLPALAERLAEAGYNPKWDSRLPGFDRFFVKDPFGNRLELMEASA
ncbi:MAG: VOC family protein [Pacificimonas sp.]|jgi:catechol 2,3-dioxygenase-like lactoylglutathione lyase family enzyme|nr:VOC family protein [Pacificimonas sp.]